MIKKLFVLASACVISLAIFGCSSGSQATTQSNDQSKESAEQSTQGESAGSSSSSLFSADEWPQNETTEGIPVPHFSVGMDSLSMSEGLVNASWKNVPESEVSSYVDEIKQAGFTYDSNEIKSSDMYSYHARNHERLAEGSSVVVTFTPDGTFSISISNYSIG